MVKTFIFPFLKAILGPELSVLCLLAGALPFEPSFSSWRKLSKIFFSSFLKFEM
jgi:hypothetical protein